MKHFVLTQMMLLMSVATIMGQEPAIPTPTPEILCEYYDSYAAIWVEGVGELHLYCNEEEVENPYYVDYVYGEQNLFFTATAQAEDDGPVSCRVAAGWQHEVRLPVCGGQTQLSPL